MDNTVVTNFSIGIDLYPRMKNGIITDHNVDETLSITDRAYLMVDGKLFKAGTAEDLANDPLVRKVYLGQNFKLRRANIHVPGQPQ